MNTIIKNHKVGTALLVVVIIIAIVAALFTTFVVLDSEKSVTIEESRQHFDEYILKIDEYMSEQSIYCDKNDVEINISDELSYSIKYMLDNKSEISLELYNSDGREQYSLSCTSGCDTSVGMDTNIDIDIIYGILEIVSGKTINKEEIQAIIMERNGKYKMELLNEQTVRNGKDIGFYGHWKIRYIRESNKFKPLYNDMSYYDQLHITGLTRHGIK